MCGKERQQQLLLTNSDNSRQAGRHHRRGYRDERRWKENGKWKIGKCETGSGIKGERARQYWTGSMQIFGYNNDVIMLEVPYMVIASL